MDFIENYNFCAEYYEISSDSDEEENIERQPRRARLDNYNIWNSIEFYNRFRLLKASVRRIYALVFDDIKTKTNWNNVLQPMNPLLLTIRYLATGNFLITVRDAAGVHRSTAGKWIWIVLQAIARQRNIFIKFPTGAELANTKVEFYCKARFPHVIGALDCTHVKMQSVGGIHAELYRNRKGFFSFKVQTICNANLKILDIVARWPGSSHDLTIFNNSNIRARFEHGDLEIAFYVTVTVTPAEQLHFEAHVRTRNPVKRSYGIWKRRFPILAKGIQLHVEKVQCLIVATGILNNIAIEEGDENPPSVDPDLEAEINLTHEIPVGQVQQNQNNLRRAQIINHFATLINQHN